MCVVSLTVTDELGGVPDPAHPLSEVALVLPVVFQHSQHHIDGIHPLFFFNIVADVHVGWYYSVHTGFSTPIF